MDEDFDELMSRRVTCRNFDPDRALPLQTAARILKRTIMAHAVIQPAPDMQILKKNIPSGGGLHPLETYAVVRNVEGLENGIHHYDPISHSLRRLADQPADLDARVRLMLAGQDWFVDAALHLIQVARFSRNFWKYRSHPKAYRAILLDAGHLGGRQRHQLRRAQRRGLCRGQGPHLGCRQIADLRGRQGLHLCCGQIGHLRGRQRGSRQGAQVQGLEGAGAEHGQLAAGAAMTGIGQTPSGASAPPPSRWPAC